MNKQLKDYLHLYLGCDISYDGKTWTLYMVNNKYAYLRRKGGSDRVTIHLHEAKPLLRPLSSMTEEEMAELQLLWFGEHNRDIYNQTISRIEFQPNEMKRHIKHGEGVGYSCFGKDGKHYSTGTLSFTRLNGDQFLFLLSKSFDLFGLIESGLAIESPTKPHNQ